MSQAEKQTRHPWRFERDSLVAELAALSALNTTIATIKASRSLTKKIEAYNTRCQFNGAKPIDLSKTN